MVVINIVCSDFIHSCEEVQLENSRLVVKTSDLVLFFNAIKKGLSRLLLLHYAVASCMIIVEVHTSIHCINKGQYAEAALFIGWAVMEAIIIFNISNLCEESFGELQEIGELNRLLVFYPLLILALLPIMEGSVSGLHVLANGFLSK